MAVTTMLLADILKLPSVDSDGGTWGYDDWSVTNALENKDVTDEYHQAIKTAMRRDGFNSVPIHVDYGRRMEAVYNEDHDPIRLRVPDHMLDKPMLGNGHHRLKMMLELGFTYGHVTDDYDESEDL